MTEAMVNTIVQCIQRAQAYYIQQHGKASGVLYLGHAEKRDLDAMLKDLDLGPGSLHGPPMDGRTIFMGVEVIEVDKPHHFGLGIDVPLEAMR